MVVRDCINVLNDSSFFFFCISVLLLGCFGLLPGCCYSVFDCCLGVTMQLFWCSGLLPRCCYAVTRIFWVVARVFCLVGREVLKCTEWL